MKNRFFFLTVFIISIFLFSSCNGGPADEMDTNSDDLPDTTSAAPSESTPSSEDGTCLANIPIYPKAQPEPDLREDLEDLVKAMESLSQISGGEVSLYTTGDSLGDVFQYYQDNTPTGGYEKTLDLTSVEEGGIIVWEKGEMSIQIYAAMKDQETVILLGCGPKLGSSAAPSLPVFTSEDGLADDTITSIDFSADGSAWIATPDGLSVYDGQNWTSFNEDNGLPGNWIVDVAINDSGDVWATINDFSYQGLARYDGTSWQTFEPSNKAAAIAIAPDGAVWVTVCDMNNGGVYRFDGQAYTHYDENVIFNLCAKDVFTTKDESLWVATKATVAKLDGNNWQVFIGKDSLGGEPRTIFVDQNGFVWVGTDAGISHFDGQTWTTYTQEDGLAGQEVNAITEGSDGSLWFGTSNGVSRLKDGTWSSYTEDDGLPGNRVSSLAIAPDGRIWVGTTFDGVAIIEP